MLFECGRAWCPTAPLREFGRCGGTTVPSLNSEPVRPLWIDWKPQDGGLGTARPSSHCSVPAEGGCCHCPVFCRLCCGEPRLVGLGSVFSLRSAVSRPLTADCCPLPPSPGSGAESARRRCRLRQTRAQHGSDRKTTTAPEVNWQSDTGEGSTLPGELLARSCGVFIENVSGADAGAGAAGRPRA